MALFKFHPNLRHMITYQGERVLLTGQYIETVCGTVYEIEWKDGTDSLISKDEADKLLKKERETNG